MALLEARQLSKTFTARGRTVQALDAVSFSLDEGKSLAVVGESGSGKSTLGAIVAGLMVASGGELVIRGKTVRSAHWKGELRREVQVVFQNPFQSLDPKKRVSHIIGEPLALLRHQRGAAASSRIAELLDLVGLPTTMRDRFPIEMSGGQQQRVAIARALAAEPDLIVLDEPTSGLDQSVRLRIVSLLKRLQRENGVAYLFITHDIDVARAIADDVLVMNRGTVVEQGPASKVLEHPEHPYTRALLDAVPTMDPSASRRRIARSISTTTTTKENTK